MTPAVAWLAWATGERRTGRPTAHEHKHQTRSAAASPQSAIDSVAPVKYTRVPTSSLVVPLYPVTSSPSPPQPLLQLIYVSAPYFSDGCTIPAALHQPSLPSTAESRVLLILAPAWSLSDPLSFRLARLFAFNPTGHNLAFAWDELLPPSQRLVLFLSLSIFLFCRLVLLLRRRHSVPCRSSITFVAFPRNATRQATLQHGPQQSSSVLPPPAGLCRFTCGRRSDGRSTSVLNCAVSPTPPLWLSTERSASECEPTSETADLDENGTLTPRPIQDVRCAEHCTCRGYSNGV